MTCSTSLHDPATLYVAYCRVEGNRGANTPGVDGLTVRLVEERIGVQEFLDDLRAQLKAGTFRPLPASCVMDVISSGAGIIGGTLAVGVADGPGRRGRCGRGRVRSACR